MQTFSAVGSCEGDTLSRQCGPAGASALTCAVAGYIDPHGRALSLARSAFLGRAGGAAVKIGQRQAAALGRQLGVVELRVIVPPSSSSSSSSAPRRRRRLRVDLRLEVAAAVHQLVLHAEVVARGQRLAARGAREAAQVVHGVPRAHHHLRRGDAEVATRAPLHGEPSGTSTQRVKAGLPTEPGAHVCSLNTCMHHYIHHCVFHNSHVMVLGDFFMLFSLLFFYSCVRPIQDSSRPDWTKNDRGLHLESNACWIFFFWHVVVVVVAVSK